MDMDSENQQKRQIEKILYGFKQTNPSENINNDENQSSKEPIIKQSKDEIDNKNYKSTEKRFKPKICSQITIQLVNNRIYQNLVKLSQNYIKKIRNPELKKDFRLFPIELNFTIKFLINIIMDLINSTNNQNFALERIYHLFFILDKESKSEFDKEKFGTKLLVLKNIMDSLQPIIYTLIQIYRDINQPYEWNIFYQPRIKQLVDDLNLMEKSEPNLDLTQIKTEHLQDRFKISNFLQKGKNTLKSEVNLSIRSKSKIDFEEEIIFEETMNNNRNYTLKIICIIIFFVNIYKLLSLIFIAIILIAIQEQDQDELISKQMVIDEFVQAYQKIEDGLIDEDTFDTFTVVIDCLNQPFTKFKEYEVSFENYYEWINPIVSLLQSSSIKSQFLRFSAGFIIGVTRFQFFEMIMNSIRQFDQNNLIILCEKQGLDSYHKEQMIDIKNKDNKNSHLINTINNQDNNQANNEEISNDESNRFKQEKINNSGKNIYSKFIEQYKNKYKYFKNDQVNNNLFNKQYVNLIDNEINRQQELLDDVVIRINRFYKKNNINKKYDLN